MSQELKPIKGSTWLWIFGVVMTVAGIYLTLVYGRATIYCVQGVGYNNKNLYDQAIYCFNRAIELNPKLSRAYYYRGISYCSKKEGGEVIDRINQYKQAISDFTVAIRLQPELGGAYCFRGYAYAQIHQDDLAISDFTRVIEIGHSDLIVEAYVQRAEIYDTKGLFEWARSLDNKEISYDHIDALYDKAISDLTRALELPPDETYPAADLYRRRGEVYKRHSKHSYDKVIMDLNRAIEADPEDARAYNSRGQVYKNKNLYDDRAISDFNRALEINPELADAYNNREETYKKRAECEQTILDNTHAIEINPEDINAYHKRGHAYMDKNLFDQAISDFNRAIEINPRFAEAYYSKGAACKSAGYKTEAVEAYKTFIKLAENNVREEYDSYLLKHAKHSIIELMQ